MVFKDSINVVESFIGRDAFFSGSLLFFRDLSFDFFLNSVHFLCKLHYRTAKVKIKIHKKRDGLLASEMEINIKAS